MLNTRKLRADRGYSQKVLAEKVQLSHASIFRYEEGSCFPSYEMVEKLAAALEVPVKDLLVLENADDNFNPNAVSDQELYDLAYQEYLANRRDPNNERLAKALSNNAERVKKYLRSKKSISLHYNPDYYKTYIEEPIKSTGIPVVVFIRMAIREKIERDGLLPPGLSFPESLEEEDAEERDDE